jgi:type IV pilus assembly protein PilM
MFGFSKPHFFGIDFGTSSIKAVELTIVNGKPTLVNYGVSDLSTLERGSLSSPGRSYDDEVMLYLRALLSRMKSKSTEAYVAMPAFIGLISLIELPEMEKSELQEAIKYEAHKYIPSPLDEVAVSWEVIGMCPSQADGKPKMEVLLVAALNKEVERYERYAQSAELGLKLLELETFSLVRAMIGPKPGLRALIDIGSRATNLILVKDGIVRASRNLDVGGRDVTRTIMESLDITQERAEALKKGDKDFLNGSESALVFPALQMILNEAKRMIESYKTKYPDVACEEIVLSGGTACLSGLADYYAKSFGVSVSIGNPWERIVYEATLAPAINRLGGSFSVALGLALSGADEFLKKK